MESNTSFNLGNDKMSEPSLALILEKREELARLRRRSELVKNFGLLAYRPHAKQDKFHCAGNFKRRYFRAGNRTGKSDCGCAEVCSWAIGYRPFYQNTFDVLNGDKTVYRTHVGSDDNQFVSVGIPQRSVKILIIVADWDKAEEIYTNQADGQGRGKLFKMLPLDDITKISKNQSGKICEIRVKSKWGGESSIHLDTIASYKSNPMGQESGDWDFIQVDEPCPQDMFVANARGLMDRHGSFIFTCTPLTEMWINDLFLPGTRQRDNIEDGKVCSIQRGRFNIESWTITASSHDNPYISEEVIAELSSLLTKEQIETRISGRPSTLTGQIYPQFTDEHIYTETPFGWRDFNSPPLDWTIYVATDTHPSTPHATLFAGVGPNEETYFWMELFEHPEIEVYVARINEILEGREPQRYLLELAAYNNDAADNTCLADYFSLAGLPVEPAPKDLSHGIIRVQQELMKRRKTPSGKLVPKLMFAQNLAETMREFDRYCWNPKTGKPRDKDDHMMENLYRLVVTGMPYVKPTDKVGPRIKQIEVTSNYSLPSIDFRALPGSDRKTRINPATRYRK